MRLIYPAIAGLSLVLALHPAHLLKAQNRDSLQAVFTNEALHDTTRIRALMLLTDEIWSEEELGYLEVGLQMTEKLKGASGAVRSFAGKAEAILCINRGWYYYDADIDYIMALELTRGCVSLAKATNDNDIIAQAYTNLAVLEFAKSMPDSCIIHLEKALSYRRLSGNKKGIAQVLANLGYISYRLGMVVQGIDYLYEGMDIAEQQDDLRLREGLQNYIGQIYYEQGDLKRATEIARQRLALAEKIGDSRNLANAFNSMAVVMKATDRLDSALYYYNKGLNLAEEVGFEFGKGVIYQNIALIHFDQSECLEALKWNRKAKKIWEHITLAERLVLIYTDLANNFMCLAMNDSALYYANAALEVALNTRASSDLEMVYRDLYRIYERKGDYKNAFANLLLYKQYSDSLFNQENTRKLEEQKMSYSFGKRENELLAEQARQEAIAAAEVKHQKTIRNVSVAIGILVLIMAFGLYRRYRYKQQVAVELEAKNTEVEAARERAERSEAFRKQFLANMSHEIRTPMNAILGMTRLMKDRTLDPQSSTYLNAIDHAANNLLVVINDILDLSKLEAGKMEASVHPANLRTELHMLSTTFEQRASEKQLRFELDIAEDVPGIISTDMGRVNQILYNLLGNAIKFTAKGKIRLEVKQERIDTNSVQLSLAVIDTGIGIPAEKQDQIFQSFGQGHTHDSRRYGGTGLGLTIARSMAELLGGTITLRSTVGVGSVFSLTLPVLLSDADALEAYQGRNIFTLSERHLQYPVRLLLADDNEYNRLVAVDTLKKYLPTATVDAVSNGYDLLALLQRESYHIILMDVQMPGMDGYECTKAIRSLAEKEKREIPVFAFTASVIRSDIDRCLQAGMDGYIPKPFADHELLEHVSRVIDSLNDAPDTHTTQPVSKYHSTSKTLFLKLVPERLARVKDALEQGNVSAVKKGIHLMRPQLLSHPGFAAHATLLEWFEYVDEHQPPKEWESKTKAFCTLVSVELSKIEEEP